MQPAQGLPPASDGRAEQASIQSAELMEDGALTAHPLGEAEPWEGPVAFLDGIQRHEVVAYAGSSPIVV
ncbi:MAG: hypothetical protein JF590_08740, partial [Gemmatimonadetes bacterium]|nr:hypothetical protein [Gemmatimonadota bacterium]